MSASRSAGRRSFTRKTCAYDDVSASLNAIASLRATILSFYSFFSAAALSFSLGDDRGVEVTPFLPLLLDHFSRGVTVSAPEAII